MKNIILTIVFILILSVGLIAIFIPIHPPLKDISRIRCQSEVNALYRAFYAYKETYGEFPKGDIIEIINCFERNNERRILFITDLTIAEKEVVDAWNTPYRISVNNEKITITSAGENKTFGDSDDIVPIPEQEQNKQPSTNPKP